MNKELKIVQVYVYDGNIYTYDDLANALMEEGTIVSFAEWLEEEYTIEEVFAMSEHERDNARDSYEEYIETRIQNEIEDEQITMLRCIDDGQF